VLHSNFLVFVTAVTVTVNCKNYKAVLFFQNGVETTVITQQLGMKRRFKG
jgi:hypothetical protein